MSTETSTGNQSTVTTEQDSFSQTLQSYTSLVNGLLAESDVTDDEDMATVRRVSSQLVDDAKEIEGQVEANEESVDETQEMVATTRREQAEIRSDVHEVKQTVESQDGSGEFDSNPAERDETPTPSVSETTTQAPQTPLGDCVTLPEPIRRKELTANVRRATEIAAGAIDYCRSVPAGYAITSSEIRTVTTALKDDDGRTYTATVGRIIEKLDEMGGDDVTVKETMGGQRTVVFDDAFIRRSVAWRQSDRNDVVAQREVSGAT